MKIKSLFKTIVQFVVHHIYFMITFLANVHQVVWCWKLRVTN